MADLSNSHSACQSDLARKRSLETSDNDAQEGSKRRGHRSALDLLLHDRAMKINKDVSRGVNIAPHTIVPRLNTGEGTPSLTGLMCTSRTTAESHRRGCIGDKTPRVVERLSEPLTTRRRRGPNVDSLFRKNSWTLKDTPDKENVPIVKEPRTVLSENSTSCSKRKGRGVNFDKLWSQSPASRVNPDNQFDHGHKSESEISAKTVLSEANVSGDSNIYKAVDIVDPSVHQPCVANTTPESSSHVFTHSGALNGIELFQTPGSSTSVSKKIKQEKEVVDII